MMNTAKSSSKINIGGLKRIFRIFWFRDIRRNDWSGLFPVCRRLKQEAVGDSDLLQFFTWGGTKGVKPVCPFGILTA
jgi:hypothetical protein